MMKMVPIQNLESGNNIHNVVNENFMKSFINPAPYDVPFDFMLNEHFAKNTHFRYFNYRPYVLNFLFSFVSVMAETNLKENFGIEHVFWAMNEEKTEFKVVIVTKALESGENDGSGSRSGSTKSKKPIITLRVKNFFLKDIKNANRGLSEAELNGIISRIEEFDPDSHIDLDDSGLTDYADESSKSSTKYAKTIDEYVVQELQLYTNKNDNLDPKRRLQIYVQKVRLSQLTIGSKAVWNAQKETLWFEELEQISTIDFPGVPRGVRPLEHAMKMLASGNSKTLDDEMKTRFARALESYFDSVRQLMVPINNHYQTAEGYEPEVNECGFFHGTILGTQSFHSLEPTVIHSNEDLVVGSSSGAAASSSNGKKIFYMTLEQVGIPMSKKIQNWPISLSFGSKQPTDLYINRGLSSMKNSLGDMAIHVNLYNSYGVPHTLLSTLKLEETPDWIQKLVNLHVEFEQIKTFGDTEKIMDLDMKYLDYFQTQLNSIRPLDLSYDTNSNNYLCRYMRGMFTSVKHDSHLNIFALYDEITDNWMNSFFVEVPVMRLQVLFNIYPGTGEPTTDDSSINKIQEKSIPDLVYDSDHHHVFAIDIYESFEHSDDQSHFTTHESLDFMTRQIRIRHTTLNEIRKHNIHLRPLNQNNIGKKLRTIKDYDIKQIESDFQYIFKQNKQFITKPNEFQAFLAGIFHCLKKHPNAFNIKSFYSKKAFILSMNDNKPPTITNHENEVATNHVTMDSQDDNKLAVFNFALVQDDAVNEKDILDSGLELVRNQLADVDDARILNIAFKASTSSTMAKEVHTTLDLDALFEISSSDEEETLRPKSQLLIKDNIRISETSMKYLNVLGSVCHKIMTGLIIRDFILDIVHGDIRALLRDTGFLIASVASTPIADGAIKLGAYLADSGFEVAGKLFRTAAPIIRQATSAFVLNHMIDNIKALVNGENRTFVKVNIGADALMLTTNLIEAGVEIAELAGAIEGVSAIFGPIGMAIGTIAIIGAGIYQAVTEVQEIEHHIHLTGWERFKEGFRAFLHIGHEHYIDELIQLKETNNYLLSRAELALKSQSQISRYILKSAIPLERQNLLKTATINFGSRKIFRVSRAEPSVSEIKDFRLFCRLADDMNESPITQIYGYYCQGAFGVENRKTSSSPSSATFFQLNEGLDSVQGFIDRPNIYNLSSGEKFIVSGQKDDIFVLNSMHLHGLLNASYDTLDFSALPINKDIHLNKEFLYLDERGNTGFEVQVYDINNIIGRANARDVVHDIFCYTKRIDLKGGGKFPDSIHIPGDQTCFYNTTIITSGWMEILNDALQGNFVYGIQGSYNLTARIQPSKFIYHKFILSNVNLYDLDNFTVNKVYSEKNVEHKISIVHNDSKLTITIPTSTKSMEFVFKDEVHIKYHSGHLVCFLKIHKSINQIIGTYANFMDQFDLTLIAFSTVENQSITLNHGTLSMSIKNGDSIETTIPLRIMHNNPMHEGHLVCGEGENVIIFKLKNNASVNNISLPGVNIFVSRNDSTRTNKKVILDFSHLAQNLRQIGPYNLKIRPMSHHEPYDSVWLQVSAESYNWTFSQPFLNISLNGVTKQLLHDDLSIIANSEQKFSVIESLSQFNQGPQNSSSAVKASSLLMFYENGKIYNIYVNPVTITLNSTMQNVMIQVLQENVELNQKLFLNKPLPDYDLVCLNNSLMITNVANTLFLNSKLNNNSSLISIFIENFFNNKQMQTLKFIFSDQQHIDFRPMIQQRQILLFENNSTNNITTCDEYKASKNCDDGVILNNILTMEQFLKKLSSISEYLRRQSVEFRSLANQYFYYPYVPVKRISNVSPQTEKSSSEAEFLKGGLAQK